MRNDIFAVLCTAGIVYCSLSIGNLCAQPPWGNEQPPWRQRGDNNPSGSNPPRNFPDFGGSQQFPGSNQQFPRDDASRSARRVGMLKGMDTNGNGTLEPAEIPEYRRDFVNRIVTELGGNPQRAINLSDLERKAAAQNSPATPSSAPSSGTAAPAAVTGDALVLPFGEKEETPSSVLSFGQREIKAAIPAAQANNAPVSASDQILRNAKDILTRFDKNRNGTLDKDKGEWSSTLPFKAESADKNLDGRITLSEIVAVLGGTTTASSGSAATATKSSEAYDHLPQGVPPWFFERDKDKDAQLTMLEYAHGQPWTQGLVNEFRFLDTNNDGFATIDEVFAVLKQTDEQKALAEDKAKREAAKTSGRSLNETPAGNPPPEQQPAAQPAPTTGSPGQAPPPNAPYAAGSSTNTVPPNAAAAERSRTNRSSRRTAR
ncbi:MAG: hypothetical protein LBT46_10855 [Planctomycetaceae bacterium]|jgi:Ca2+-binding EF-hand superfamily protein|nr:hypothetical protein [Planctomycetaceae bacterium]